MTPPSREQVPAPEPSAWWIECSETVGIDQVLALAAPSARHLVQLAPGRLRLRLFRLAGPGLEVDGGWANLPLRAVGTSPPARSITVSFVLSAEGHCTMRGHRVGAGTALLWPPGLEYDGIAPAGHRWATALLPAGFVYTPGARGVWDSQDGTNGLRATTLSHRSLQEVLDLLEVVDAWRDPEIADLDPRTGRECRDRWYELVSTVLRASAPLPEPEPHALRATELVRRCKDHLLANLQHHLRVPSLCEALGVSRRTIETAFRQVLDTTPAHYLETLRAHALFLELRRTDAGAPQSVREAETRCGVFHPSRFAAHYRSLFGENPSATFAEAAKSRSD